MRKLDSIDIAMILFLALVGIGIYWRGYYLYRQEHPTASRWQVLWVLITTTLTDDPFIESSESDEPDLLDLHIVLAGQALGFKMAQEAIARREEQKELDRRFKNAKPIAPPNDEAESFQTNKIYRQRIFNRLGE